METFTQISNIHIYPNIYPIMIFISILVGGAVAIQPNHLSAHL